MEAVDIAPTENIIDSVKTQFTYEPLDSPKEQIRLNKVLKQSDTRLGNEISHWTLETFDWSIKPSYVALSYVWGPPLPTLTVMVNGQPFTVRQNLHDFLMKARQAEKMRQTSELKTWPVDCFYWIDQISIDQNNLEERASQVSIMGRIYAHAAETIVWLELDPNAAWKQNLIEPTDQIYPWEEYLESPLSTFEQGWLANLCQTNTGTDYGSSKNSY